jgi:general secretion pathway protein G
MLAGIRLGPIAPLPPCGRREGVRVAAQAGFTLIELLVVLAIVALLITIAVPRYVDHVERARETALKTDLKVMREAIDKFEGDQGRLPANLTELVERRYLKEIPPDPITDKRDTWIAVTAAEAALEHPEIASAGTAASDAKDNAPPPDGIADVRSGAPGTAKDGSEFRQW